MVVLVGLTIVGTHCTIACLPVSHAYSTPFTVIASAVGRAPLAIGDRVATFPPALTPTVSVVFARIAANGTTEVAGTAVGAALTPNTNTSNSNNNNALHVAIPRI